MATTARKANRMVTASVQPDFHSPLLGETTGPLALRVQGTEHDGRVLHIRSPKCLIGSDPACTLRLRSALVRPFHCLILRGTEGTFIRRWSPDTCLNGRGFDESRLHPGDRISIGAIELEVLPSTPLAASEPPIPPPVELHQKDTASDSESVQECQRLRDELHRMRQEHQRLQALVRQQDQQERETEAGYRTLIEDLRGAIISTKSVCHDQLIEHQTLASQAEATAGQLELLQGEVDALRDELDQERCQAGSWRALLEAEQAQAEILRWEIETLRSQVTQATARAADRDLRPPTPQSVPSDHAADIAIWKDVTEGLRRELQQTREEHQRVREEWHVDRESLERELNARNTVTQQLEQKYRQDMCEAERLIHAMQQEGKHLLVQLDEVKQSIRQGADGHKKKRPSLAYTVRSLAADAAGPPVSDTPDRSPAHQPPGALPETPPLAPQSACCTMLMEAPFDVEELVISPPPAAELPPCEPDVTTPVLSPNALLQTVEPSPEVPAERVPPTLVANTPSAGNSAGDELPVAVGDSESESEDAEDAIQRYMERLLDRVARIRGDQDTPPHLATPQESTLASWPATAPTAEPTAPLRGYDPIKLLPDAAEQSRRVNDPEKMSAAVTPPLPPAPTEPTKPRVAIPPELSADLLAIRELANRTVQRNVDRTDDRQATVAAIGDLAVASVCLVFGVLASALSPRFISVETMGGAIGIAFGMISLVRGLRTGTRLHKRRSEARKEEQGTN